MSDGILQEIVSARMLSNSKVTGSEMSSRGFAHLKPLASDLVGRTLALRVDDLPGNRPLQAKGTPGLVRRDIFGTQLEQEQIGHDRHGYRAFHPLDLFGDLMLPQPHDAFEFLHQQLYPPPAEIDGDNLTCGHHLWQMGHED